MKCSLVRGKYNDEQSSSDIFDAMKSTDSKIVNQYSSEENELLDMMRQQTLGTTDYATAEKENMKNLAMSFDLKDYGVFKGLIRIGEKSKMDEYEKCV